jgi:hypothetical protein
MLFKQGYVVISLKSSLQKLYSRHHLLVGRYKTSISQMTMDFFTFYADTAGIISEERSAYPSQAPEFTPGFLMGCV